MTIELLPLNCPWSNFLPPTMQFCERNLCSYITTPANTWSNIAYIIIGSYLFFKKKGNTPTYLVLFPIAAISTGIASFLYHASFTFLFQFFDLSSMYFFSSLLVVLNWHRLNGINDKKIFYIFIVLIFFSMSLLLIFKSIGVFIFGLHLVTAIFLEFKIFRREKSLRSAHQSFSFVYYRNFLLAISCFIIAFLIWILDFKRIICDPENHILQGHAIWHILTAFCYLFLYRFYDEIRSV